MTIAELQRSTKDKRTVYDGQFHLRWNGRHLNGMVLFSYLHINSVVFLVECMNVRSVTIMCVFLQIAFDCVNIVKICVCFFCGSTGTRRKSRRRRWVLRWSGTVATSSTTTTALQVDDLIYLRDAARCPCWLRYTMTTWKLNPRRYASSHAIVGQHCLCVCRTHLVQGCFTVFI